MSKQTGFSLIEFLVAMTVTALMMAAALTVTLSSRRVYSTDRTRTQVNQNLRGALDMVGLTIRQAGERLPGDFPAIEVINGSGSAPDQLILRRNLADDVLPLCANLTAGSVDNELRVADSAGPHGCKPLPDNSGDGFADNISEWRTRRAAAGGTIWAYLYNPTLRVGEWIQYDSDGPGGADWIGNGSGNPWSTSHNTQQLVRAYILEQKRFDVSSGLLRFHLNQDIANPVNLSAEITDFQVRIHLVDGSILDGMDATVFWTDIQAVEVSLAGNRLLEGGTVNRSVSAQFFPRGILSD